MSFTLPNEICWFDRNNDQQQQENELALCHSFLDNNDFRVSKETRAGVASALWTSGKVGDVTVTASSSGASASAQVRFSPPAPPVQPVPPGGAPRFYGISPSSGSARGGYTATISGQWLCKSYLRGSCYTPADVTLVQILKVVSEVQILPDNSVRVVLRDVNREVALRVTAFSGTGTNDSLQVVIPEADSSFLNENAKVDLKIANGVGSAEVKGAFEYVADYREAGTPIIFEVQPNQGSWQGGEEVTITGQNLCVLYWTSNGLCDSRWAPSVVFNPGSAAPVVYVSPDGRALRVRTPSVSVAPITQDIYSAVTVRNSIGDRTVSNAFVYVANREVAVTPVLHALSPNAGPIEGGTRVTIYGTGFQYPVQVLFGDREAQVVSSNFNQIVCIAPSIAATQPTTPTTVDVSVKNVLTGKTSSNTLPYRYGEAMFVSAITPNTGYILGWNNATIYGQGFVAPVQVLVTVAGLTKEAQVLSVSGPSIQVKMPPFQEAVSDQGCTPVVATFTVTNIGSNLRVTGPGYTYLCSGGISGP
ncbi:MAG: IPT/TIG domain-containing protein [Thermoanaerobaculum sp.]|nr:IPT/TIG domain-containing protein [Thermoanaerobaculum sp.]